MKGLIFSAPMMKSWLAGNKTVTRRLMNPQPDMVRYGIAHKFATTHPFDEPPIINPPYHPGETVYIKEVWGIHKAFDGKAVGLGLVYYRADYFTGTGIPGQDVPIIKWKSPRFMPEWASRSNALIVSVRPEQLNDMTPDEFILEGFQSSDDFIGLWTKLHGIWTPHTWVWRIELEKLQRGRCAKA